MKRRIGAGGLAQFLVDNGSAAMTAFDVVSDKIEGAGL